MYSSATHLICFSLTKIMKSVFHIDIWNEMGYFICSAELLLSVFSVLFVQQIATQIAVLIAKVARLDCPRQWPELIPILLESVKGQDSLQQHRALLTFYHVTKTLASKCLAPDRRLFQDVSPIFTSVLTVWWSLLKTCLFFSLYNFVSYFLLTFLVCLLHAFCIVRFV